MDVQDTSRFISLISTQKNGNTLYDLDKAVKDAIIAVGEHGGKAEITLKLVLKLDARIDNAMEIDDKVDMKLPKKSHSPSLRFITKDNRLVMQKEEQASLGFEEAERQINRQQLQEADKKITKIRD